MKFIQRIRVFFTSLFAQKAKTSDKKKRVVLTIASKQLGRTIYIELYPPPAMDKVWSLLLLNDGQDAEALQLEKTHAHFLRKQKHPLLIAAIHAGDRMQEYGTAGQLNDKGLGKKSNSYQQFILKELLPQLHRQYPISAEPKRVAIAGFSLGGLSALDMAWSYPKIFGTAGVFSGALWWRSHAFDAQHPDANRIIHQRVEKGDKRQQRFWMMAGTADEVEDRNKNGIIDAIDDTLQLLEILKFKLPAPDKNLKYLEVEDGTHDPQTWSKVLPDFLNWTFRKM